MPSGGDTSREFGGRRAVGDGGGVAAGLHSQALSRLLNGKAGISPVMALALEGIGWSNAGFWMRLQASYELAQARRDRAAAERRAGALHA